MLVDIYFHLAPLLSGNIPCSTAAHIIMQRAVHEIILRMRV